MKQILPLLFLFFTSTALFFPPISHATISFEISNPVREGDYFIIDAKLSGISSGSAYIQGMFTNISSSDYFGFTWGQKEDWVEYQTTTKDFIATNLPILIKDTVQKIWVKPNYTNPGYKGPGDYYLKLRRFTGSSDSATGDPSNSLTVYLLEVTPTPTPTPTPTSTPTSSPAPTPTDSPTPTIAVVTLVPTKTPTPTPVKTPTPSPTKTSSTPTSSPAVIPGSDRRESSVPRGESIQITPTLSNNQTIFSSASAILGTSTSSANLSVISASPSVIPGTDPESIQRNPQLLKYTFIFGIIVISISGGILYFRHRTD